MDLDRAAKLAKIVGAVAVPIALALGGYSVGEGTGLEAGKAKRVALREKYEAGTNSLGTTLYLSWVDSGQGRE